MMRDSAFEHFAPETPLPQNETDLEQANTLGFLEFGVFVRLWIRLLYRCFIIVRTPLCTGSIGW